METGSFSFQPLTCCFHGIFTHNAYLSFNIMLKMIYRHSNYVEQDFQQEADTGNKAVAFSILSRDTVVTSLLSFLLLTYKCSVWRRRNLGEPQLFQISSEALHRTQLRAGIRATLQTWAADVGGQRASFLFMHTNGSYVSGAAGSGRGESLCIISYSAFLMRVTEFGITTSRASEETIPPDSDPQRLDMKLISGSYRLFQIQRGC